jgi:hypothetical protein
MERPYESRPASDEFNSYYAGYVNSVQHSNVLQALEEQIVETQALLQRISDEDALYRYEPGKWTIKEMLGHLIDAERIFAYRALRFARADESELQGFEQEPYVTASGHNDIPISELIDEFVLVRKSNVLMFRHLPVEAWLRVGVASKNRVTVRALAWILAGHEMHHVRILRERYLKTAGVGA